MIDEYCSFQSGSFCGEKLSQFDSARTDIEVAADGGSNEACQTTVNC